MLREERMAGLAKGLSILEAFGTTGQKLTISDVARATDLSRATAKRCLSTLAELGYASFDGKFYSPAPRVLRLGAIYAASVDLPQLAAPYLDTLRDTVDESTSLAVLLQNETFFIARSEGRHLISSGVRVGASTPLHFSATGQVLLAGMSEEHLVSYLESANLTQRTKYTVGSVEELTQKLAQIRIDGYAICIEEMEIGLSSIASPVRDANGEVVAAMSVSTSTVRTPAEAMKERFASALRRQSELLGRQL